MSLKVGDKAPEISLPNQDGQEIKLADYKGGWVLVYFYPKDDTPGCTVEACGIRDKWADYKKHKITVLGISIDSPKDHVKFIKKYELPFTLLSDENKKVVEAYGVWQLKKFMGREYMGTMRHSFLIDPQGKIAKIYLQVKPEEHATEVVQDCLALAK